MLLSSLILLSACNANKSNDFMFVFLSVRLKGNNDGTISATAQNEFTIGFSVVPVKLSLYRIDSNNEQIEEINSTYTDDLNILEKLTIDYNVDKDSTYYAQIEYTVKNQIKVVQSEKIKYNEQGIRL
jgi:hypothetical protein